MRTIAIKTELKLLLDEYSELDESYDSLINRLLDEVSDDLNNRSVIEGYYNIGVSDDTLNRLKSLKVSKSDSYTKLLSDALSYVK